MYVGFAFIESVCVCRRVSKNNSQRLHVLKIVMVTICVYDFSGRHRNCSLLYIFMRFRCEWFMWTKANIPISGMTLIIFHLKRLGKMWYAGNMKAVENRNIYLVFAATIVIMISAIKSLKNGKQFRRNEEFDFQQM